MADTNNSNNDDKKVDEDIETMDKIIASLEEEKAETIKIVEEAKHEFEEQTAGDLAAIAKSEKELSGLEAQADEEEKQGLQKDIKES